MMRRLLLSLVLAVGCAVPAVANEFCDKELAPLGTKRAALQAELTSISKNPKAKNARERFCRTIGAFIGNLQQTESYMKANQEFCQIPAEVMAQVRQGVASASKTRRQVCQAPVRRVQQAPVVRGPDGQVVAPIPKPPVELRLK